VSGVPRTGKVLADRLLNRSDYSRWSNEGNLERWWETRTARLAGFIPAGSRIIEFGAGTCRLPRYLDSGSVYIASDLVTRIPGTIVCDLNKRPLPDLGHLNLDVAVFAGVLEYLVNLPSIVEWLSTQVGICVASYDGVDAPRWTAGRIAALGRRKYFGYMNDYEPGALVALFEQAGFRCLAMDRWDSQELYLFVGGRSRFSQLLLDAHASGSSTRVTDGRPEAIETASGAGLEVGG
jgi:hypothetical protein